MWRIISGHSAHYVSEEFFFSLFSLVSRSLLWKTTTCVVVVVFYFKESLSWRWSKMMWKCIIWSFTMTEQPPPTSSQDLKPPETLEKHWYQNCVCLCLCVNDSALMSCSFSSPISTSGIFSKQLIVHASLFVHITSSCRQSSQNGGFYWNGRTERSRAGTVPRQNHHRPRHSRK